MSITLKAILQRLEYKYGKLGEAQSRMLEELFLEEDNFAKRPIEDIWQLINKSLIDKAYIPLSERHTSMDELFPTGDEYPDIYRESLSNVDMNDLL